MSFCDGPFDLCQICPVKKGGLITQQHNEVRDALGDLSREVNLEEDIPALRADLGVWGVWLTQCEALFNIRVVDTDAQSYRNRSPEDVLRTAEK